MPYRNLTLKQQHVMKLADKWLLEQRGSDIYTINGIYAGNTETLQELEKLGLIKQSSEWSWKKVTHPRFHHLLHRKETTC